MTNDSHQGLAVTTTEEYDHPINADVYRQAIDGDSDQDVSDTELEKMENRREPVCSRLVMLLEPVMFVYALYLGAIFPLLDQYVRSRIFKGYHSSGDHITNSTVISNGCSNDSSQYKNSEVDSEASLWMLSMNAASFLPSIVSLWMLGSYSDTGGRKIAIIIPQIGALVRCIIILVVVYFDLPLYIILIGAFLEGLSGGIFMIISAGFSYVADITLMEKRSFRITVLDGCFSLGTVVSQVAAGYLIASLGYTYPFLILTIIMLLDTVVAASCLPETVTRDPDVRFWSLGHFQKAFHLYFRDNGTGRRWKLLLSLIIVFFSCSVIYASIDVQTFYLLDVPFCLSPILIGYFGAMLMLISAPFSMLMTKFTLSVFGDSGLLLIGAVSSAIYQVVMTFSTTKLVVFMAPVVGAGTNLVPAMVRSISSKLVKRDEEGAMFATIAVVIIVSMIMGQLVFNNLYSATVFVWPPLTFLVMLGTLTFTTLLAVMYIVKEKLEWRKRARGDQVVLVVD